MATSWRFHTKNVTLINFNVMWLKKFNIRAPVLLNLSNSLRTSDKMLGKPRILSLFPN